MVKARRRQRTGSTHVPATVRTLNRLERVGETTRAALNEVAVAYADADTLVLPRHACSTSAPLLRSIGTKRNAIHFTI